MALISNLTSLKNWFEEQNKPYWTLYNNSNVSRSIIARNDAVEDLDRAWSMLQRNVLAVSERNTANIRVFVTDKPKNNHGFEVEALIGPNSEASGAAISGLPAGYVDEARIGVIINQEKEKWEMQRRIEDLENAAAPEQNFWDKAADFVERIGSTPLGTMLIQRFLLVPGQPVMGQPINGTPGQAKSEVGEDEQEYSDAFFDSIEETAETLGVSPEEMAAKLASLVKANPDLAKQMLQ